MLKAIAKLAIMCRLSNTSPRMATHMLLYLDSDTFVGEIGQRLAHEVRQARMNGLPIILMHEVDTEQHRGCAFDRFVY